MGAEDNAGNVLRGSIARTSHVKRYVNPTVRAKNVGLMVVGGLVGCVHRMHIVIMENVNLHAFQTVQGNSVGLTDAGGNVDTANLVTNVSMVNVP